MPSNKKHRNVEIYLNRRHKKAGAHEDSPKILRKRERREQERAIKQGKWEEM